MDGIAKAKDRGVKFGRKRELTDKRVEAIKALREAGETVPSIIKRQQGRACIGHSAPDALVNGNRSSEFISLPEAPPLDQDSILFQCEGIRKLNHLSQCEGLGKLAILSPMAHR